ncbi:DUF6286 domain-containing protein [Streptomyces sp. NPDC059134]|uniref:DUF6286 domain-containing protein n=1 Tax=Streptomyces sp. NPDC059134 TaxID=3346738 RepID=UPI0036C44680
MSEEPAPESYRSAHRDRDPDGGGVLERDGTGAEAGAGTGAGQGRRPTLDDTGDDDDDGGGGRPARAGRFWSFRRVPAGLAALILLGATGLLLYDIAAVRAGHRAMYWRRALADQLARRPLEEVWILVAAAVATALGLWLLALALTPGLRRLLPMRRQSVPVRAGLDREAAELTLRDRAMEVSGVRSARVRLRRSRAKVNAAAHFRALDEVRADLERALDDGIAELGLARRPALTVRVHRPARKG